MADSTRRAALTISVIDEATKTAREIGEALQQAEQKVKAVAAEMGEGSGASDRFVQSLSRLKLGADDIKAVANEWKNYTTAAGIAGTETSALTREQISGIRNWENAALGSIRAVMKERNAETAGLRRAAAEQNEILTKQAEAQKAIQLESARSRHGLAARGSALGQVMPLLGPAIIAAVAKGVEAAAKIQGQDLRNLSAGIPEPERNAATRQAIALSSKYPNLGTSEVLQTYRELRSVLPDSKEVPKMMDVVVKAQSAMEASGLGSEGLIYALKAAELLGKASSPEALKDYLNSFVKAQQVEGKTIDPEGMFNFAQQLKAAAPNLSSQFVNTLGPLLLQELGANGGTAVSQFEKQIQGGFQGNLHAAAKEFVAIGLASKDDFELTKTGEIKGMKHGHSVVGADIAEHDPDKWVYDTLVPALVKAGYATTEEQIKELPRLFPNQNAANVVAKLLQQKDQWAAKADRIEAAPGTDSLPDQMQGVSVAFGAFKTQLLDFIGVLDGPAMKDIGAGLSFLTTELGAAKVEIDKFAQAFPTAARALADLGVAAAAASGGWLSMKLLAGFGLTGSATALSGSAAELSAAAVALGGKGVLGAGGAAIAGGGVLAAGAGALTAGSLIGGDISGDSAIDRIIKSQHPNWSADDMKAWARSQLDALTAPGVEIRRAPGRDVRSPQSGLLSYTPPAEPVVIPRVDSSAIDGAQAKVDAPGRDVRSPQSGLLSYTPPAEPVVIPRVDSSAIDGAQAKVDALGHSNPTVSLSLDTSAFDAAINRARAAINSLGALIPGTGMSPSYGSHARGNFTASGFISGE